MAEIKPFAFVLMPFDKTFGDIYEYGIKQACSEMSIVAERVDEQHYSETMLERIYRQIENADLIIADMTGKNPNVFYEVGYAHAKGKPCTLITQRSEDIPFDLKHHVHIIYNGNIGSLKAQLLPRLKWTLSELERSKAETLSVSVSASTGSLDVGDYIHSGEFNLKILLKNIAKVRSPEIDSIVIHAADSWSLEVGGKECASEVDAPGTKKYYIPVPNSRIAPGALSQTTVTFKKNFWSKWSGEEKQEKYKAKGKLIIDVATAEGTLPFSFDIDVDFEEYPF